MIIRKTTTADLDTVCRIYDEGRAIMRQSGNHEQWGGVHPPRALIEEDIRDGTSYVCVRGDEILCVFYFNIERDPTYAKIDGAWLNDEPYGVVHRIARGFHAKGAGAFCLQWCFEQCGNLRIDTHSDNVPMRRLLDKLGFTYCGIIWIENGDERLAFQKRGD
ncbi:MAG: GNAT family N-acetyltransferase [Oscillospiraceae bacterium]|nr:GNAT family N-acetyltransferase [Oscillospiraceae bacterium]